MMPRGETPFAGIAKREHSPLSQGGKDTVADVTTTERGTRRNYVHSLHKFPKFLGPSRQKGESPELLPRLLLSERIVQELIVAPVKAEAPSALVSFWKQLPSIPLLNIDLEDDPEDDATALVRVRGCEMLVDSAKQRMTNLVRQEIRRYNLDALLADEDAMELDLLLKLESLPFCGRDASILDALGIDMLDVGQNRSDEEDDEGGGLWIDRLHSRGQLDRILGKAAHSGVAIRRVGNIDYEVNEDNGSGKVPIHSLGGLEEWYERSVLQHRSIRDAHGNGASDKTRSGGDVVTTRVIVTVALFGRADLSGVDAEKGITPASTCPRNLRTNLPVCQSVRSRWHEERQRRNSTTPNAETPNFQSAFSMLLRNLATSENNLAAPPLPVKTSDSPRRRHSQVVDLVQSAQFGKKTEKEEGNIDDKAAVKMTSMQKRVATTPAPHEIIDLLSGDEDGDCGGGSGRHDTRGRKSESYMEIDQNEHTEGSRHRTKARHKGKVEQTAAVTRRQSSVTKTGSQIHVMAGGRKRPVKELQCESISSFSSKRKIPDESSNGRPPPKKLATAKTNQTLKDSREHPIVTKKLRAHSSMQGTSSSTVGIVDTLDNSDDIESRGSRRRSFDQRSSAEQSSVSGGQNVSGAQRAVEQGVGQNTDATEKVESARCDAHVDPQDWQPVVPRIQMAAPPQLAETSREKAFLECSIGAITTKKDAGVFARMLKNVRDPGAKDSKGRLLRDYLQEALHTEKMRLKGCLSTEEPFIKKSIHDLQRKKSAMAIYVAVREAVDKARSLHDDDDAWETIEFVPRSVRQLVLKDERDCRCADEVFYHVTINGDRHSRGTPGRVPLQTGNDVVFRRAENLYISYKKQETTKFMGREIWIDLMKGNESTNKTLARFTFTFGALAKNLLRVDDELEATPEAPSPFLLKGTIVLRGQKVKKTYAVQTDVSRLAYSMKRFHSDVPTSNWDVDTRFPQYSLLHAAVYGTCPRLVNFLLNERRHEEKSPDDIASPRQLAEKLYHELDATAPSDLRQRRRRIVREFELMQPPLSRSMDGTSYVPL